MFDIKEQLKKLPHHPGVYLMKDEKDEIIYVGKAVSLKNRVRQYFQSHKNHTPKVRAMVENIKEFEYILTDSEVEALILESNLIKKHRPKYNVLLRDDKQYPYIKVTMKETFPRVLKTRHVVQDGSKYFGPYIHVGAVNQTIEMLKKFYPIRTCRRDLKKEYEKPCLNYHIQRCLGPCIKKINEADYKKMIQQIIWFLSGKYETLVSQLKSQMQEASAKLEFEKAAQLRDEILAISQMMQNQKIISDTHMDQDVIAMAKGTTDVCVMIFFVRSGKLIGREHYMIEDASEEKRSEILSAFMKQFYGAASLIPKEILLETEIDDQELIQTWLSTKKEAKVEIKVPQRGEKKALVEMVHKNALETMNKFLNKLKEDQQKSQGAMKKLEELLQIPQLKRIEAFDISNTQGVHSVASMVVFEGGKPKRSDYRRFKIKTVQGPSDYHSMQEVIYRRFRRGLEEQEMMEQKGIIDDTGKFSKFPDLILMDGGLAQIHAAQEVLQALKVTIPVAGMVKDDHHKTKDLLYEEKHMYIQKQPLVFQMIGRIQEETHRFAITYHKSLRGKTAIQSILENIKGVGKKRRVALLKHFGSIDAIKKASIKELSEVEGMNKNVAYTIQDYFNKKDVQK